MYALGVNGVRFQLLGQLQQLHSFGMISATAGGTRMTALQQALTPIAAAAEQLLTYDRAHCARPLSDQPCRREQPAEQRKAQLQQ